MRINEYDNYLEVFEPSRTCVRESEYWLTLVRTQQLTLGDCIIAPRRKIPTFGSLTDVEAVDLSRTIAWYEDFCIKYFKAEKFNYIAAMMRDDFAHLHAFPRYSSPSELFGVNWVDTRWPRVIQFETYDTPQNIVDMIIKVFKSTRQ